MPKEPNNFPREGLHTTVTKDAVKRLERQRPVQNMGMHYTIGGSIEATVHSNLNAEREAAITNGARALNGAAQKMQDGFQASKPDARTEYIRAQLTAARQDNSRDIAPEKLPARQR